MFQGPCDPHPCIEYGLLPVWALRSYAVRAFCPYARGAPAGSHPPWMDLLKLVRAYLDTRGALLLDLRTPQEYHQFHFDGAILVPTPNPPLTSVDIEYMRQQLLAIVCHPGIRDYRPIVTYCRQGIRAGIAAELLREAGFLYSVCAGGIETMPLRKLIECGVELCPC